MNNDEIGLWIVAAYSFCADALSVQVIARAQEDRPKEGVLMIGPFREASVAWDAASVLGVDTLRDLAKLTGI